MLKHSIWLDWNWVRHIKSYQRRRKLFWTVYATVAKSCLVPSPPLLTADLLTVVAPPAELEEEWHWSQVLLLGKEAGTQEHRGDSTGPGNREHLSHPASAPHLAILGRRLPLSSAGTAFRKRQDKHRKENQGLLHLQEPEPPFAVLHICPIPWQVGGTREHSATLHRELAQVREWGTDAVPYRTAPASKSPGSICIGKNMGRIHNWCPMLPMHQKVFTQPWWQVITADSHRSSYITALICSVPYVHDPHSTSSTNKFVFLAETRLCPC